MLTTEPFFTTLLAASQSLADNVAQDLRELLEAAPPHEKNACGYLITPASQTTLRARKLRRRFGL
jgi:hypothetical protein